MLKKQRTKIYLAGGIVVAAVLALASLVPISNDGGEIKLGSRANRASVTLLDAATTTGAGTQMRASAYRNIVCSAATAGNGSATWTLKFAGSIEDNSPDFDVTQSVTNTWDYVEVVDLQDGSAIDGDTGISVSGAKDVRQVELNTNALAWISPEVTSISGGSVTVDCKQASNQ